MLVRPADVDDAGGWARVVSEATPYLVLDDRAVRHEMATARDTPTRLVAEVDGALVGLARVRDRGALLTVMVQVVPAHRRRGLARALLDTALARTTHRATEVSTVVNGDDGSQAAAVALGFTHGRRHTMSAIDPRVVPASSYDVVGLGELPPEAVHACYATAAGDDPSGLSREQALADFVRDHWDLPTHRPDLGRAVVDDDGHVLAFTMTTVAGDRAWNAFTGTRPDARGHGLARRVKAASLVALAEAGVTRCATGNDAANAPMLAVNTALGYAPIAWTSSAIQSL